MNDTKVVDRAKNNFIQVGGVFYTPLDSVTRKIIKVGPDDPRQLTLINIETNEITEVYYDQLIEKIDKYQNPPIYAPNMKNLAEMLSQTNLKTYPHESVTSPALMKTAKKIIDKFELIERILEEKANVCFRKNKKYLKTDHLPSACKAAEISESTYYEYRKIYKVNKGDQETIASDLRRSTNGRFKIDQSALHYIDTMIVKYYAREDVRYAGSETLDTIRNTHETIKGYWIDLENISDGLPDDLIEELLDPKIPIDVILENSYKAEQLKKIELPSRTTFYDYLKHYSGLPDLGEEMLRERYGDEFWEHNFLIFDSYVHIAQFPLQYVFADHLLLEIFILDEETRSEPFLVWLTILVDAFSRSIIGFSLLPNNPCIESVQMALQNAIWSKKDLLEEHGIKKEWICSGIPVELSLDNAWAHHSNSLENLSRVLQIDLVFRPPYKGRYGTIVERGGGTIKGKINRKLVGGIREDSPDGVRDAKAEAIFLYEDLYGYVLEEIVEYQHTPHSGIDNMTPHEKWVIGSRGRVHISPPKTEKNERLFLREYPDKRANKRNGLAAFGLYYKASEMAKLPRYDNKGREIEYTLRYDPNNISIMFAYRGTDYICKVRPNKLLLPNGDYMQISVTTREMAKRISKQETGSTRNWVDFTFRVKENQTVREKEQERIRSNGNLNSSKPAQAPPKTSPVEMEKALATAQFETDEDDTQLLLNFNSTATVNN